MLKSVGKSIQRERFKDPVKVEHVVEAIEKHLSGIDFEINRNAVCSSYFFKNLLRSKMNRDLSLTRAQKALFIEDYNPLKYLRKSINKNVARYPMVFVSSAATMTHLVWSLNDINERKSEEIARKIAKANRNKPDFKKLEIKKLEMRFLVGSQLEFDRNNKPYKRRILRLIEKSIETGKCLVLIGLEQVYDLMYDFFNQKFSILRKPSTFCNIVYDERQRQTKIHPDFRCVVVKSAAELSIVNNVELQLPSPLLNRFEKHLYSIDHPLKEKMRRIKVEEILQYMERVLKKNPALKGTDWFDKDWRDVGNHFIYCFQRGELVKMIALYWELFHAEHMRIRAEEESVLLKYEFVFDDLVRYYSFRMLLAHCEFIKSAIQDRQSRRRVLGKLVELYRKSHREESLKEFLSDESLQDRPENWVVMTSSRTTEYDLGGRTIVLYSKALENMGDQEITDYFKFLDETDEKDRIVFSLENKRQFRHLKYLLWKIDENGKKREEKRLSRAKKLLKLKKKNKIATKEQEERFLRRYTLRKKDMGIVMHFVDHKEREEDLFGDRETERGHFKSAKKEDNGWYFHGVDVNELPRNSGGRFFVIEDLEQSFSL